MALPMCEICGQAAFVAGGHNECQVAIFTRKVQALGLRITTMGWLLEKAGVPVEKGPVRVKKKGRKDEGLVVETFCAPWADLIAHRSQDLVLADPKNVLCPRGKSAETGLRRDLLRWSLEDETLRDALCAILEMPGPGWNDKVHAVASLLDAYRTKDHLDARARTKEPVEVHGRRP